METSQFLLAAASLAVLYFVIHSSVRSGRNEKDRAFAQRLETVLKPTETVKLVCPQKKGRVVLTSRRVLFETRSGFTALELKAIKRVQGINEAGNRTTSIPRMKKLLLKGEQEYEIYNTSEEFADLAKILTDKIKKQNEKQKAKKEAEKCKKEEKS